MQKLAFIFITFLLLGGCAQKHDITSSKSVKVTFKSNAIKVLDLGFLRYAKGYEHLQVLNSSQVVLDIEVKNGQVCINDNCFEPKVFNQKILSPFYDDDFIVNILSFLPIFKGQNLNLKENGFEQNIVNENVDIIYQVDKKSLYFKDKSANILIRINLL